MVTTVMPYDAGSLHEAAQVATVLVTQLVTQGSSSISTVMAYVLMGLAVITSILLGLLAFCYIRFLL